MSSVKVGRKAPKRVRLETTGARPPTRTEIEDAIKNVKASGVVPILEARLNRRRDAERRTSIHLLTVATSLNAYEDGHKMELSQLTRVINALPHNVRRRLGSPNWTDKGGYDRVQRLYAQIAKALAEGWEHVDTETGEVIRIDSSWYLTAIMRGPVPTHLAQGVALALDGTSMETFARLNGDVETIELDGSAEDDPGLAKGPEVAERRKTKKNRPKKRLIPRGTGPDGRNIFTKDPDARGGYRTATGKQPGSLFVGYQLHLGTSTAPIKSTDGVTYVSFGPKPPPFVLTADLVPAGQHNAKDVVNTLLDAYYAGFISEVIADGGYTMSRPEYFHHPLREAGVEVTLTTRSHQRAKRDGAGGTIILDGHPFSPHTPQELWDLPMPPSDASAEERKPYIADFEERAAFRYTVHSTSDGATRWRGPLASGRIRTTTLPETMRNANARIVSTPPGTQMDGTFTTGADELPLHQRTLVGTPAWTQAIGRRNLSETTNSRIKGGDITDINSGYIRMMTIEKISMALAHTLAALNRNVLSRWLKDQQRLQAGDQSKKRKPRRDRARRWEDTKRSAATSSGSDPPG